MKTRRTGGMVYSTELGRTCPQCRKALDLCSCRSGTAPLGDGRVRVGQTSKGRGGKTVTIVSGLPLALGEMEALATRLKKRCGTGGTIRDGTIEIQGEHRDGIIEFLRSLGYQPKPTGG